MNALLRFILLSLLIVCIPFDIGCLEQKIVQAPTIPVQEEVKAPLPEAAISPKVVLITIDGTRWQELFEGTSPVLNSGENRTAKELVPYMYHYFHDNGMIVGRDSKFIASGPMHISLPGYLEIMRGHPSTDCQTNQCTHPKLGETIADLFDRSAVFASWDTIKLTVSDKNVNNPKFIVNCGRHYRSAGWKALNPRDYQTFSEYWEPEYRPDTFTADAVFTYLKVQSPDFLWVSLGDTDEWAHAGNYANYLTALGEADTFIGRLISQIAKYDNLGDYTFIVTADHGRNLFWQHHGPDKESEKDWLMMFGRGVPHKGFVTYPEVKSLSNIKPTVEHLVSGKPNKKSLL